MKLEGKRALVTGGSSGIGRATTILLAQEGAAVAIGDVDEPGALETQGLLGAQPGRGGFIRADIARPAEAEHLVAEAVQRLGGLDIVANCAGVNLVKAVVDTDEAQWDRVIDIDLKGTYLVCKFAIREMLKAGRGSIVNISSGSGLRGSRNNSAYAAAKGGVIGLTMALAIEYAEHQIRVNAICPGLIITPMSDAYYKSVPDPAGLRRLHVESNPIKRAGQPEEIARLVLFMASDDSSYMTGAMVPLDGGNSAG